MNACMKCYNVYNLQSLKVIINVDIKYTKYSDIFICTECADVIEEHGCTYIKYHGGELMTVDEFESCVISYQRYKKLKELGI